MIGLVFLQIESLLERMQDENTGLPIKSVKSFMSKIPSVLTGADLIQWILKTLDVDDTSTSIDYRFSVNSSSLAEALHLANLISSHGYVSVSLHDDHCSID